MPVKVDSTDAGLQGRVRADTMLHTFHPEYYGNLKPELTQNFSSNFLSCGRSASATAKERLTQHAGHSGSSITSHVPNFDLIRQEAIR